MWGQVYGHFRDGSGSRDFGFRNQIQRAAVSVMNNIAEGFERGTNADFARLLDIARASCAEVRSLCYAAEDLGYLDPKTAEARRRHLRKLASGISSLATHLRATPAPSTPSTP